MNTKDVINQYISQYIGKLKINAEIGTVSDINDADRTCVVTPLNGDSERLARFQASLSLSEGLYIKPVDGSYVGFVYLNNEAAIVICYSEIQAIWLDADTIILNDGNLGGLVKVVDLVSRLNLIEGKINDFLNVFNTHVHAGVMPGVSVSSIHTTIAPAALTKTVRGDIENEDIRQ